MHLRLSEGVRRHALAPALLATLFVTVPAAAAGPTPSPTAAELQTLREQLDALKAAYEARIQALETRLQAAEQHALRANDTAAAAAEQAQQAREVSRSAPALAAGGNRFNPDIGLVLQGRYRQAREAHAISGFLPGSEEAPSRGFTLDETELNLAANIDPDFRGALTLAFTGEEVEVEEAYFQTLSLGRGFTLRGGRFFSGVGYLNEQHSHAWDFADAPLAYDVLFGGENHRDDGLQLKWLAPLETVFLELGGEIGRGAQFPGTDRDVNGANGYSVFGHVGGDVGVSHAWRAGLSYLSTRAREREAPLTSAAGEEALGAFSGDSKTWLADFVWKWAPAGNPTQQNLKLQAEYFQRQEDGRLACSEADGCDGAPDDYDATQRGFYAQAVWQFLPRWRVGYRYDRLYSGNPDAGLLDAGVVARTDALDDYDPRRHSVMFDWSPSEFSRLRLQYNHDESTADLSDDQIVLQYIYSLGAHGAHKF